MTSEMQAAALQEGHACIPTRGPANDRDGPRTAIRPVSIVSMATESGDDLGMVCVYRRADLVAQGAHWDRPAFYDSMRVRLYTTDDGAYIDATFEADDGQVCALLDNRRFRMCIDVAARAQCKWYFYGPCMVNVREMLAIYTWLPYLQADIHAFVILYVTVPCLPPALVNARAFPPLHGLTFRQTVVPGVQITAPEQFSLEYVRYVYGVVRVFSLWSVRRGMSARNMAFCMHWAAMALSEEFEPASVNGRIHVHRYWALHAYVRLVRTLLYSASDRRLPDGRGGRWGLAGPWAGGGLPGWWAGVQRGMVWLCLQFAWGVLAACLFDPVRRERMSK